MLSTLSPPAAPSTIASDEYPVSPISASMYSSRSPSPTGTTTTTGTGAGVDCDPRRFFQSVALTEPLGRIVSPGARAMQADAPPLIDRTILTNSVDMKYQITQPLRVQKIDPWYNTYNDQCVDFYPSASGRFLPFNDDLPERASISSLPTTPCSPVPVPLPSPRRSSPPPLPFLSDSCSSLSIGSAVDNPVPSPVDTSPSPPGAHAFEDSVLGLSEVWDPPADEPPANKVTQPKRPLPQPPVAASASSASTHPIPATQTTTPPAPSTVVCPSPSPAPATASPAPVPRDSVSSVAGARPLPPIPGKAPVKKLPSVPEPPPRPPVKKLPAVPQPPTRAPVKKLPAVPVPKPSTEAPEKEAVPETSTAATECEPPKRLIPEHTPGPLFSTVSRSLHRRSRPAPLDLGRFSNLPLPPLPDERPSPRSFAVGLGFYYPKAEEVSSTDVGAVVGTSDPSAPSSSSPAEVAHPDSIRTGSAKSGTQRRRPTSEEQATTPVSQTAARPSSDPRANGRRPEEALDEKNYIFLPKHAPRKAAVVLGLDFHDLVDKPTSKPKVLDQVAAKAAKLVSFRGRGRDQAARGVGQRVAFNGQSGHVAGTASIKSPNATGVRAVDGDLIMDFDDAGPSSSPWLHNDIDAIPPLGVDSPTKTITSALTSASTLTPTFTPPLPPTPTPGPLTSTELAARQNALMETAYYPDHDDLPQPPSRPWLKGNDSKGSLSSAASKGSSAGSSMPTAGGQPSSGCATPPHATSKPNPTPSPRHPRPFSPSHKRNKSSTGSAWSFGTGNRMNKDRPVISRPLDQALEHLEPADGWASIMPLGMQQESSSRSSMDSIPPSTPPKMSPDADEHRPSEHSRAPSQARPFSPSYRSHTPSPSIHSFTTVASRLDPDPGFLESPRPAPQPPLATPPFASPQTVQFPRTPRSVHSPHSSASSPRAPSRQSRTSRISHTSRAPSRAAPSPTPSNPYSPTPTTRSLYAPSVHSPTTARSVRSMHMRSPTPGGRYAPASAPTPAPPPDPIEEEEEVSWFEPDTPAPTTTQVMAAKMGEGALWVKHTFNRRV